MANRIKVMLGDGRLAYQYDDGHLEIIESGGLAVKLPAVSAPVDVPVEVEGEECPKPRGRRPHKS